jgi:hypothetical protein
MTQLQTTKIHPMGGSEKKNSTSHEPRSGGNLVTANQKLHGLAFFKMLKIA